MAIAHASTSTIGIGSTTVTPPPASGLTTGDACICVIVTKPNTASIATPANWTLVGGNAGGSGTNGASTGPTRVGVFFREKDATWSTPPAFSVTSGNSTAAASFRFTKDPSVAWDLFNRNGTYNGATPGTNLTVITAATNLLPGDYVCTALSNHDDAPLWGSQSYSASGITFDAVTEFADNIQTITGNDVGGAFWGALVTAGEATSAITQQATATANSTGAVVLVRIRESALPEVQQVTYHRR